ncbi:fimbria/pilus outer membrane usher protein [Achromobacter seleniivolatilans]|uniref:Fimbria/pilus outer membrane usher protein n=1 Tax=Achromobacter seleniivolatilans TaxID=3047478 RepID=A0ABY9M1E9_9BURK|nr:fimbria/pilus outer membrane usher protein [Achromobacter sp. R39]WMD20812.1 fimbria/pilus outer membrane usher protein [Achromobacter sp. R39]
MLAAGASAQGISSPSTANNNAVQVGDQSSGAPKGAPVETPQAGSEGEEGSNVQFNPAFFQRDQEGKPVDVSRFSKGNPVVPGRYTVEVRLNQSLISRQALLISVDRDKPTVPIVCIRPEQLSGWGINVESFESADRVRQQLAADDGCVNLAAILPEGSKVGVDMGGPWLDLTIAQRYLTRLVRGYVDPASWDRGINAAVWRYSANYNRQDGNFGSSNQLYLNNGMSLNLAGWRLQHNGVYQNYSFQGESRSQYQSINTYAQKGFASLTSQVTLGQYFTPGDLFDSFNYTGVQLATDDRMWPESLRGYAPRIRGVAETNARVSVIQNGVTVYQTTVSPGEFEINDLYATGYAGDLTVAVTETDGRTRSFVVPYSAVQRQLRAGMSRYNVTAGRYRSQPGSSTDEPAFAMGTYQRGLSDSWTLYGGGIGAADYAAVQLGAAARTPVGSISLDATNATARGLPADAGFTSSSMRGTRYRASYNRTIETTSTSVNVAASHGTRSGYLGFEESIQARGAQTDQNGLFYYAGSPMRNQIQINVSQPVGSRGQFYANGVSTSYWENGGGSQTTYQAGYSHAFGWGSMSFTLGRTRTGVGDTETTGTVWLTVPLGRGISSPLLRTSYARSGDHSLATASILGTAGERRQATYSAYASMDRQDGMHSNIVGASGQYSSSVADYGAAYSTGGGNRQLNLTTAGAVVAHSGGVAFGPNHGETMALIHADGAEGAAVTNNIGTAVGSSGYAVISGLQPFRQNRIELDPKGTPTDVELLESMQQVAPYAGSVVLLNYATRQGAPLIIELRRADGKPVPLGADVVNEKGESIGMVGQGGRAFVRAESPSAKVKVSWGDGDADRCSATYDLSQVEPDKGSGGIRKVEAQCRPVSP